MALVLLSPCGFLVLDTDVPGLMLYLSFYVNKYVQDVKVFSVCYFMEGVASIHPWLAGREEWIWF